METDQEKDMLEDMGEESSSASGSKRTSEEMDGTPPSKVAFFEITGLDGYHIGMDHIIIYIY